VDEHGYSPPVLGRIATATARSSSFRDAADAVAMSGIATGTSQVRRPAHEVGAEPVGGRDRRAVEHRRRRLPPRTAVVPEAVAVEVDGGRIGTRAAGSAPGAPEARNKEARIACLATSRGPAFATDLQPGPPESSLCPRRVRRLVAQMKGLAGGADPQGIPGEAADRAVPSTEDEPAERWSPGRSVRTCVASPGSSPSFGPVVAAEARQRHSYDARRRAFVADGAAYNRSTHEGYSREFEPVADLLRVPCYLYSSARAAGADEPGGRSQYAAWVRACWRGRAGEVPAGSGRVAGTPG
jgi:hypothetical protein